MDLCRIDQGLCKGCELCVAFCPKHALEMGDGRNPAGYHPATLKRPDLCNGCALCAEMCPETAIVVYRRRKICAGVGATHEK